ncbi:MAG: DGQHR domain-containing protein [Labilithrix sp.]|nr:DGQHR domain-containing protein [Labilithrix sp.]
MLTLPALKVRQFSQEFFLLNLAAGDIERLVRFEVLGSTGAGKAVKSARPRKGAIVNWHEIEERVQVSEEAYQRPVLRKKLDELAQYYLQCRDDGAMPAVPGAVLLTSEEPVEFVPEGNNPFVGLVKIAEPDDALRVLDGQHRLLALAALVRSPDASDAERAAAQMLQVPAVLFSDLPAPAVIEMFVTINSKHTRLNSSLLFSLKGRQLYADPLDAAVHDVIRRLNDDDASPLEGQIKMLGVGPGRIAQSGLAQELKRVVVHLESSSADQPWFPGLMDHLPAFYLEYFKVVARAFEEAWTSRSHSIRSLIALRAFLQVSEAVVPRVLSAGGDPRVALARVLAPWRGQIGSSRFETAGTWKERTAGGGKETTRRLARELTESLERSTEDIRA